jgi:hypothetical protein
MDGTTKRWPRITHYQQVLAAANTYMHTEHEHITCMLSVCAGAMEHEDVVARSSNPLMLRAQGSA